MNNYDQMVGGGISSLLQAAHENVGEPGAFNFAPKNEPVLKMARGGFNRFGEYIEEDTSYLPTDVASQIIADDPSKIPDTSTTPAKTDVVGNLKTAGLQEIKPSVTATTTPSITASNLIQQFTQANPEFAKDFDFSNVGRLTDESTGRIEAPSAEFGGYTVKAIGNFADVGEGSYAPVGGLGGYEATKSEMQANGKPLINTFRYDASGALTGRKVQVFEGSDSGTEFELDAAGNIVGASKFDYSESWKQTAIPLLQMAALAAAPYLQGAGLATKIGAGAAFSGANAALQGKEGSDLLRAAAIGGAGAGVGAGLGETAGKYAGSLINDPTISPIVKSAVEGGIKALPGAIATGDYGRALTGALVSGGMQAADIATADVDIPFTRQQAEAGINFVRAVNSGNMMSAANAAATLINNPDITIATRAATLLKAMQSGNINAMMAAAQMLGNTVGKETKTTTKTAEAPGGAFETSAIIDEFGDMGGTLVPGEGGESVNIFGTRSPEDISLDYFFSPEDTTVGQKVDVQSRGIKPEGDISSVLTGEDLTNQRVGVEGSNFPIVGADDVTDLLNVLGEPPTVPVDQRVDVTGKTIKPEDVTDQKVDVTSTKIPPETTKTTTTPATTPTVKPPAVVTKKPVAESPAFTPVAEAAPQQVFRPGVVTDAYEVLFGPGAPSLMGFTKAERAKQILARKREEEENQPETAYDRLMSMAEKDPVGTVDQLMKIIEGD